MHKCGTPSPSPHLHQALRQWSLHARHLYFPAQRQRTARRGCFTKLFQSYSLLTAHCRHNSAPATLPDNMLSAGQAVLFNGRRQKEAPWGTHPGLHADQTGDKNAFRRQTHAAASLRGQWQQLLASQCIQRPSIIQHSLDLPGITCTAKGGRWIGP